VNQQKGHVDNRLGSFRQGILVMVVCLVAGFTAHRLSNRGGDEIEPLVLSRPLMGTLVTVTLPGTDDQALRRERSAAAHAALDEVARVDSLFSWRRPAPRRMTAAEQEQEQHEVLAVGLRVMNESNGAFDPRIKPLIDLWGFDGGDAAVPEADALAGTVKILQTQGQPIDLQELAAVPDVLHFGAWAKGYAVDRALEVLRSHESAALVDAGGEVRGFGADWTVGVQHPRLPGSLLVALEPGELAVATSGDYEQFFEQDGERYCHLLDPRTGWPAKGCRSVTVLAPDCARADALATAVFVLGPTEGMNLVEGLPGIECLIIDAEGERHDSSGLDAYLTGQ